MSHPKRRLRRRLPGRPPDMIVAAVFAASLVGCTAAIDPRPPRADAAVSLEDLARRSLRFAEARLRKTAEAHSPADGLPRSTLPDGRWNFVQPRDWTTGFFPGLLWYMYQHTRDDYWRDQAIRWTKPNEPMKAVTVTHDLGFMLNNSFGHQYRLTGDPHAKEVVLEGSRSLITRFHPKVGATRSWDHGRWRFPVIIDNMMNLEMLFWAATNGGDPAWRDIAITHALTTLREHVRDDGSTFHVVDFDTATGRPIAKRTHQGFADSSTWARGQAWGLYGYTMVYRETGDPQFLDTARKLADHFLAHLPADRVPYWDLRHPAIPIIERDASAAAIAASGLLELAEHVEGAAGERYHAEAEAMLRSLATRYTTEGTEQASILRHAVGSKPAGTEVDVGLIYADYYFVEALLRYLDPPSRTAAGDAP